MHYIPSQRKVCLHQAAANLLVARDTIRSAVVALHSGVTTEDDPMWEWAKEIERLGGEVEPIRVAIQDATYRRDPGPREEL